MCLRINQKTTIMKIGQCRGRNREKLGDIRLNFVGVNNQIIRVGLIHKDLDE